MEYFNKFPHSTLQELKSARVKLFIKYHPDVPHTGCPIIYKQIEEAYNTLLSNIKTSNKKVEMFKTLDSYKKLYKNSAEELDDIISEYMRHSGDIVKIIDSIAFSSYCEDEDRIRKLIQREIKEKNLISYKLLNKKISTYRKNKEKREGESVNDEDLMRLLGEREKERQEELDKFIKTLK